MTQPPRGRPSSLPAPSSTPPDPNSPRLYDGIDGFRLAVVGGVQLAVWGKTGTREMAELLLRVSKRMVLQHPEGVSSIHSIVNSPPLPEADARRIVGNILKDYSKSIRTFSLVLEGTGFWASAVRTMVAGMVFVAPTAIRMEVFSGPEEALSWSLPIHASATGTNVDDILIAKTFHDMRTALIE